VDNHIALVNHTSQVSVVLFTTYAFTHWLGCRFLKKVYVFNISLSALPRWSGDHISHEQEIDGGSHSLLMIVY
jgi:hypothetical protein